MKHDKQNIIFDTFFDPIENGVFLPKQYLMAIKRAVKQNVIV